ncbi:MAG: protein kinase domain-containing protein [Nannocystaceae bacterium]
MRLGRFVLLDRLGEGGIGTVHLAYDPQLDRRVALKLLHTAHGSSSAHRIRLLREAQALARLAHPNVVPVHDAGIFDNQVYLVMEYVRGKTLREVADTHPSWRTIISMYLQAGKGLAAAHRAGVIHRDFKPDNAIRGDDGRVRVLDFGLARGVTNQQTLATGDDEMFGEREHPAQPTQELGEMARPQASVTATDVGLEARLTVTGAVMGTPAYMAPEQFLGEKTDARTDQFCFCASLWEALYGSRPFHGDSLLELSKSVQRGEPKAPTRTGVPGWLQPVLARGLAVSPGARWKTMDELLAALRRDPTRKRWLLGTLGLGIALAVGGLFAVQAREQHLQVSCTDAGAAIDQEWSQVRRDGLRETFEATGRAYGRTSYERVDERLSLWADTWREARTEACLDHELRSQTSDETYTKTLECLSEGQQAFSSLVASLHRGHGFAIQESISAAAALASPTQCLDKEKLERRPLMPPELAGPVREVRGQIADARTSKRLGELGHAERQAKDALARAKEIDWAPLMTRARLTLGSIGIAQGKYERARAEIRRVYFEAREQGLKDISLASAIHLVYVTGVYQMRPSEGMLWADLATAELAAIPSPGEMMEAQVDQANARMLALRGNDSEALARFQRALGRLKHAVGPTHPDYGDAINNLAILQAQRGAQLEARDLYERSLEINESTYGRGHPRTGKTLENLGYTLLGLGDVEQATLVFQRNMTVHVEAFGWRHVLTAEAFLNFGALLDEVGESARALEYYTFAIGTMESLTPKPLISLVRAHSHLGELLTKEPNLFNLTRASQAFARALALAEENGQSTSVFFPLEGLANVEYALGRYSKSLDFCERALSVSIVSGKYAMNPVYSENVRFLKAQVLWDMGNRSRSRTVALETLENLEKLGPEAEGPRTGVKAWVKAHTL